MSFVHLHVHSHYSLLDGGNRIPDLVKQAKKLGMDALALTDHGCMFGAIEFYTECQRQGVKPIIGIEAYIAPGDRRDRSTPSGNAGEAAYHLVLLAQDLTGYRNLLKLASTAYIDGFYYKPRIDKSVLMEHNAGLICTSACLGGEVASALLKRDAATARKQAETYLRIFGPERFFIEVQKQGVAEQDQVNPELVEIARKLGCGLVGTNDVHFLTADDHHAHDVLCCISMNKQIDDPARLKYPTELYLKSPAEMGAALKMFPEAVSNTRRIADLCNLSLDFSKRYAPVYRVPADKLIAVPGETAVPSEAAPAMADDERYLRQLCEEGLEWRYGTREVSEAIRTRLAYELKIISSKNFCSYFLIVWDFCNFARSQGIPVGARGSGVGTMVGYLLGLCNVDPLRYGLLFERFMDPSRNEMPDIDIDICQDGRQKVIDYVRQKYGHVAQIITFNTLAARAACKDVGRVLGMPLSEVDRITKLIAGTPGMTLDKAISASPELAQLYNSNVSVQRLIDVARRLEGTARNAGCHAAGVVIADQPLDELVPLYRVGNDILTQFEGPVVEKCGLLKMDFLGLRTLSVLTRSVQLVKQTTGADIDLEAIDLSDQKVFELFRRGQTVGIFQFESEGMQNLLMQMKPDRIEDLIAANALYRPGPMQLIGSYCARKHGSEPVPRVHPIMDGILAETYGIMVYQEQVMQIFNQLGGIELSAAYKLIKAISKKVPEIIEKYRPEFMKGVTDKGVAKSEAERIFAHILEFGGYGFNKSHSTRYSVIAFQTAYMKVYYPVQYMAALLTYDQDKTDKVTLAIEECRRVMLPDGSRGIEVLPPDVNHSMEDFTPVFDRGANGRSARGVIRFGLCAVKGVGEKAVNAITAERAKNGPYKNIYDLCERVDLRALTRATLESLARCGALGSLGGNRAQLLAVIANAMEMGQQTQADKRSGQLNMFAMLEAKSGSTKAPAAPLPNLPELPAQELLQHEKDLLGFYITSHPLAQQADTVQRYITHTTREAAALPERAELTLGGMIARVKFSQTKSGRSAGQRMGVITLEDMEGKIDAMIFAETLTAILQRQPGCIEANAMVFVKGKIDRRRENPCVMVEDVIPFAAAVERLSTGVRVVIDERRHTQAQLARLDGVLAKHAGRTDLGVQFVLGDGRRVTLRAATPRKVRISSGLVDDVAATLGERSLELAGDGLRRLRRLRAQQQQALFANDQQAPAEQEPSPEELAMVDDE